MKRRDFLRTAGGAAGATAAASAASSAAAERGVGAIQDEDGNTTQSDGGTGDGGNQSDGGGNQSEGGASGGGGTQEIVVGPSGDQFSFSPDSVTVAPGTTVTFTWESDGHNIAPQSQPDDANWEGHPEIVDTGSTYEHTFETVGTYEYVCEPHAPGMSGSIEVAEDAGSGGGGYEPPDPSHMGIPLQKHFIGAVAFMGVFLTLVFTFYVLKYGESAHTAAPGKRD